MFAIIPSPWKAPRYLLFLSFQPPLCSVFELGFSLFIHFVLTSPCSYSSLHPILLASVSLFSPAVGGSPLSTMFILFCYVLPHFVFELFHEHRLLELTFRQDLCWVLAFCYSKLKCINVLFVPHFIFAYSHTFVCCSESVRNQNLNFWNDTIDSITVHVAVSWVSHRCPCTSLFTGSWFAAIDVKTGSMVTALAFRWLVAGRWKSTARITSVPTASQRRNKPPQPLVHCGVKISAIRNMWVVSRLIDILFSTHGQKMSYDCKELLRFVSGLEIGAGLTLAPSFNPDKARNSVDPRDSWWTLKWTCCHN